ncbi:MAG: hypothetical protein WD342_05080 [Verrucomicrobiales bacterium]
MTSKRSLFVLASGVTVAIAALIPALSQSQEEKPDPGAGALEQLSLRVEMYDLPAAEALRIQQDVSIQPDQTEAVEEILEMVEAGEAAFVTSAPLIARNGNRAKFEDVEVVPVIVDFTWNEEAKELVPKFADRVAGTVFEVDPKVSDDGETLDINFALEHHTGKPVTETILVPLGDSEKSREVSVTRFFMKKVTTRLLIKPGASALIGAFEIPDSETSSGEDAVPDPKRLAFLRVEVQSIGGK